MKKPDERLPVVIDSREQLPFFVHPHYDTKIVKIVRGLPTGDYSLAGFESRIAIERKSLADLYHSFTHERGRFEREFIRLAEFEKSVIVVEASLDQVLRPLQYDPCWQSKANPEAIVQSILSWMVRYPTQWILAKDRPSAESATFHLLRHFWNRNQVLPQTTKN